ncbi:MAG: hypothetical protein HIU86_03590 [Acidobacteria bacterium]|nr:hypothetical protein [Acidobacteriota bacterium]
MPPAPSRRRALRPPPLPRRAVTTIAGLRARLLVAPRTFLIVWLIVWTAVEILLSHTHMYSWHYVMTGSAVLRSPTWFELYGRHPELQMGPLTFIVAQPFSLLPAEAGRVVAAAAMAGVGLLAVRELRALVPPVTRRDATRWLVLSAVFLVGWLEVAVRFGHMDDVMALFCGLVAVRFARADRLVLAGVLFALAIDFKPWAAPFAVVLLMRPMSRRRIAAIVVMLVVVAAAWLPFLALDPAIMQVTRFVIRVDPASTLHLFSLAGSSTPAWCRPAQFGVGALLALLLVRTGRWHAALVVVIAVRLLLDPATQPYYDSGLLLGSVLFDLVTAQTAARWRSGATTAVVVLLVYLPSYLLVDFPEARAVLRTVGLLGLIAFAVLMPPPARRPRSTVIPATSTRGRRGGRHAVEASGAT